MLGLAHSANAAEQSSTVKPDAFAYHTAIDLSANGGPFYRFDLPLQVYQGARRQDLGDLRVFNGAGEAVPYTLLREQPHTVAQDKNLSVPVFPIKQIKTAPNDSAKVALEVQRKSDGTLIAVHKEDSGKQEIVIVQGAIFDISQIKEPVHALHMEAGPSNTPFHAFTLETSDDLQQWHTLLEDAQLVHLQQGGQIIDKNTFEWDRPAGKYLRVLWSDPAQAPAIVGASITSTHAATSQTTMVWTDPITPQKTEGSNYDYALQGQVPLEQIRIGLAQINTLAPMQVQRYLAPSATRQQAAWETIAQTVAYRVQSPQGEVRSPDIVLNTPPVQRLRLAIDASSGGAGSIAPTLQIGFTPQTLVFLPRGAGPFTLAWSANGISDASLPVSTLLPNYEADKPLAASPAKLQPIAPLTMNAQTVVTPEKDHSKGLLWAVLSVGLLVLVGMVVMLLKQMREGTPTEK